MASNTIDVGITPGERVTIGHRHFYWSQLEELSRRVRDYLEEDLPYDTQLALAAFRGAMKAQEDVMTELEEELPVRTRIENPEYASGHHDGYSQGIVHALIGQRAKLERAQKAAEETRQWAYDLARDAENVFGAASATVDALLDLTTDDEARAAEQRLTTAKLAAEYSRSHRPPLADPAAATVPVTVSFLNEVRSVLDSVVPDLTRPVQASWHVERVIEGVNTAIRDAQTPR